MLHTFLALALSLSPQDPFPPITAEEAGLDPAALAGMVDELQGLLERDAFVGGELLVVTGRRTVLHECFGVRDREKEEPWTVGTVCNIRSMTKTLTGAAAQLLIDRGLLALDDPVAKFVPGFDTDAARAITVRQLLTHRAGLPLTILERLDEFADLKAMADAVGARGPEYEPGSRFWYSDAGTDVLGAVVAAVSGRALDAFVREELLEPLGMTQSFYYLDDEDPRRAEVASLYIGGPGHWSRFTDPDEGAFYPFAWGSQSLYSTPRDYALFLALWMDGGAVGDRRVLSREAVQRTLTPVSEMSMLGSDARFPTSFTGLEVDYGQMSVLHVPEGAPLGTPAVIFGHSGSDGTIAWAWQERDLMVLFFTQSRGGGAVLRLESVLDRLLISPAAHAGADVEAPPELAPLLGTYVADFASHMKEPLEVRFEDGKLVLDVPSQMAFELQRVGMEEGAPADEPQWQLALAPVIRVHFGRDEDGAVDRLLIEQGGLTLEAPRRGTARQRELEDLERMTEEKAAPYLGAFRDEGTGTDIEVQVDGDYLAVAVSEAGGMPARVVHLWKVPVGEEDVWQIREAPMVSVVFVREGERVVEVRRVLPGGKVQVARRVE